MVSRSSSTWLGLIALFGGFVILQQAGMRFRKSSTWEQAAQWLAILRIAPTMLVAGGVMLLVTGLFLAQHEWSLVVPWVDVAIAVVVTAALVTLLVVRPGLERMAQEASERHGPIAGESRSLLAPPLLWSSILSINGGALGVLWLMTNKPGWVGSIAAPLVLMIAGWLVGERMTRTRGAPLADDRSMNRRPVVHGGANAR